MVKGGKAFSHKCSRITGIKICNPNFHKEFVTLDHSCSSRQQSCSGIPHEDGWYPQSTASKISKSIRNYLLSHQITITAEYLPSRLNDRADWESRNATDSSDWQLRQKLYLKITKLLTNTDNRSVCLQAVSPTSPVYGMEARSKQFCNRCNAAGLEQNVWFCIPTLQFDRLIDKQGSSGKCRSNDTIGTHMADTALVYSPTKNIHATSISFTSPPKPITKSPGRKTSSCENQVSGWKNLEIEGISSSAAKLISLSRRSASIAGYESAWNKWVSWCCRQQTNPVCAPLSGILNYLSTLFEKGPQYRTINSHHSAISAYHDHVDGKPVGKHPRACALLTGILNQRSPQPRYTFVWDVETVLLYLKTKTSDNSQLPDKDLTHKLTVLMALSSASRASSLQHLNIKFMARNEMSYKFYFHELYKSWRRGKAPRTISYQAYTQDPNLCVVRTLDEYIFRSQDWGSGEKCSQLLLSFLLASSTISGWLKNVLKKAGIDISTFKAHSTRSASTSTADLSGALIEEILKRGSWSKKSTYNKNIREGQLFQEMVFK